MAHDDEHVESGETTAPAEEWDEVGTSVIGRATWRDKDRDEPPAHGGSTVSDDEFVPL